MKFVYIKNTSGEVQRVRTGLGGGKRNMKPNQVMKFSEKRASELMNMYHDYFEICPSMSLFQGKLGVFFKLAGWFSVLIGVLGLVLKLMGLI